VKTYFLGSPLVNLLADQLTMAPDCEKIKRKVISIHEKKKKFNDVNDK
jgi:hypothetical protein